MKKIESYEQMNDLYRRAKDNDKFRQEIRKAIKDQIMYGRGFVKITTGNIEHISFFDIGKLKDTSSIYEV